jgi:hypothetical protein
METNEDVAVSPTNPQAIISLVFGILTALSFCAGVVPIPFSGFVCFPASFLLGIFALIFGALSLNQIRKSNEAGLPMAWLGVAVGGLVLACLLFVALALILLFIFAPNSVPLPPFIQNFQI